MWRKVGQIVLAVAIWAAITAYVLYSAMLAERHKQEQSVERVAIEIADSTASGQLITSHRVKEMLLDRGIATINTNIDKVNTQAIKEMICSEGFVDDVDIYASYSGTLHIRISQRTPLMRFVVDGYDCYITADGYLFRSPQHAALYVPVVSGDYRPLFESTFEGELKCVLERIRGEAADSIRYIEQRKAPVAARKEHYLKRRKALRDSTIVDKAVRQRLNDNINGHLRDCEREFGRIAAEQNGVRARLAIKERRYADFMGLIELVARLQRDRFWRAEIVQIVATTTSDGALSLMFVPRSGNHRILFGWIADVESKLHNLQLFYDRIAVTSGWDSYKTVDLRFADRVVCTYNVRK